MIREVIRSAGVIICLIFFSGLANLQAQVKNKLTIQEVINLSIKNSNQLKASRSRIDLATASLLEAKNNQLPNFNLSGSYLRLLQPNIDLAYKTGTSTPGSQPPASPKISQAAYGIANISYPIYAGGRIKYAIESAKYLQQAASLDGENDKEAIALNAINAFINIYKASLTVNILKNNLEVSRKRDSSFSRLEQNGLLPRNDLLKTELQTSGTELNLLEAQSNLELAAINLNLMLGIKGNAIPELDSNGLGEINVLSLDEYQGRALQNRKDLSAIALRKKAIGFTLKSAKSEAFPTIALTGGYIAAYVPKFITISNAINAGIGIQYNFASLWKINTKLLQAKAQNEEIEANEQMLGDAVTFQVDQAYLALILSEKKIDVYQKAIAQASENYRITKNKYDNSLVTITELLDADVANQQANLNYNLGKADVISAYNKLLQTTGILKY